MHAVLRERPDIAIVDIRLPPTFRDEGLRAALELRELAPETAILIVSQYVERAYAAELLAVGRGGIGYLLKDRIMDVDGVRRRRAPRRGRRHGARPAGRRAALRPPRATGRSPPDAARGEVLAQMAEGRSNAGIAEQLVLTVGAVEKHVAWIFTKLRLPPSDSHRRVLAVLAYLDSA